MIKLLFQSLVQATEGRSWWRAFLPCENDGVRVETNPCPAGYGGCCGWCFELRDTQMVYNNICEDHGHFSQYKAVGNPNGTCVVLRCKNPRHRIH
jgi:hypothetical protein